MRIALVNKVFSTRFGGGERYAWALAHGLVEAGHDVILLGHLIEDPPKKARIEPIPMPKWLASRRVSGFARNAGARLKQLKSEYDVSFGLTQVCPVDAYFLGGGVHRYWLEHRFPGAFSRTFKLLSNPVNHFHLRIEKELLQNGGCQRVISNSNLCLTHAAQYYGLPEERGRVIYHGVDLERFSPGNRAAYRKTLRDKLQIRQDEILFLILANGWERKGLPTLLQALSLLPAKSRYRLVVAGKEPRPSRYRKQAQSLGVTDRVMLLQPTSETEAFYAAADAFVLPTRYDPFAGVTLEALAAGLPVVTTATNGGSEIIESEVNGYVVDDPMDAQTLAKCLAQLMDTDRCLKMGSQARDVACGFTWKKHFKQIGQALEALI